VDQKREQEKLEDMTKIEPECPIISEGGEVGRSQILLRT